jgi:hypothetical protein
MRLDWYNLHNSRGTSWSARPSRDHGRGKPRPAHPSRALTPSPGHTLRRYQADQAEVTRLAEREQRRVVQSNIVDGRAVAGKNYLGYTGEAESFK